MSLKRYAAKRDENENKMKDKLIKPKKSGYNIHKMEAAKKELLKRITVIFDKYEITKSDRSQLHNLIRGVGMIKLRIKKSK